MNTRILLILLSLFSITSSVNSQDIDELIELHKQNTKALYTSRGSSDSWKKGDVSEYDIRNSLEQYTNKVGIIIYSHKDDTLSIVLMDNQYNTYKKKQAITKDSLIYQISMANKWFSNNSYNRGPTKRGANTQIIGSNKSKLKNNFERINILLLPFKNEIEQLEHLIIIPIYNISTLPFAAFKVSDENLLIDKLSYSIAPSLFELKVAGEMKKSRGFEGYHNFSYSFTNALFIANPKYTSNTNWNFPNLPGAEKEVELISSKLDPKSYTILKGTEATISNIKKDICNYDLLYFATHGISNSTNPLDSSFLVLADDENGGIFTAREIQDTRKNCVLKADLVILSACQTGLGKEHEGGIIGLSRAFNIAGANHVLMSLWSINDKETAILMDFFFDYLKIGGTMMPHEALRQAIIKYKNEVNDNPNIWASFSIFGIPY